MTASVHNYIFKTIHMVIHLHKYICQLIKIYRSARISNVKISPGLVIENASSDVTISLRFVI